jgi:hypothetical protein
MRVEPWDGASPQIRGEADIVASENLVPVNASRCAIPRREASLDVDRAVGARFSNVIENVNMVGSSAGEQGRPISLRGDMGPTCDSHRRSAAPILLADQRGHQHE